MVLIALMEPANVMVIAVLELVMKLGLDTMMLAAHSSLSCLVDCSDLLLTIT